MEPRLIVWTAHFPRLCALTSLHLFVVLHAAGLFILSRDPPSSTFARRADNALDGDVNRHEPVPLPISTRHSLSSLAQDSQNALHPGGMPTGRDAFSAGSWRSFAPNKYSGAFTVGTSGHQKRGPYFQHRRDGTTIRYAVDPIHTTQMTERSRITSVDAKRSQTSGNYTITAEHSGRGDEVSMTSNRSVQQISTPMFSGDPSWGEISRTLHAVSQLLVVGGVICAILMMIAPLTCLPFVRMCIRQQTNRPSIGGESSYTSSSAPRCIGSQRRVAAYNAYPYVPSLLTDVLLNCALFFLGGILIFIICVSEYIVLEALAAAVIQCQEQILFSDANTRTSLTNGIPTGCSVAVGALLFASLILAFYGICTVSHSSNIIFCISSSLFFFLIFAPMNPNSCGAPASALDVLPPSLLKNSSIALLSSGFCCMIHTSRIRSILSQLEVWCHCIRSGGCIFSGITFFISAFPTLSSESVRYYFWISTSQASWINLLASCVISLCSIVLGVTAGWFGPTDQRMDVACLKKFRTGERRGVVECLHQRRYTIQADEVTSSSRALNDDSYDSCDNRQQGLESEGTFDQYLRRLFPLDQAEHTRGSVEFECTGTTTNCGRCFCARSVENSILYDGGNGYSGITSSVADIASPFESRCFSADAPGLPVSSACHKCSTWAIPHSPRGIHSTTWVMIRQWMQRHRPSEQRRTPLITRGDESSTAS